MKRKGLDMKRKLSILDSICLVTLGLVALFVALWLVLFLVACANDYPVVSGISTAVLVTAACVRGLYILLFGDSCGR